MEQLSEIKKLLRFEGVSDEAVAEFSRMCVRRSFTSGEILYFPGGERGKVYLIFSGEVKIYRSSEGKKIVIQVLKPGDFFGDLSFAHSPYPLRSENFAQTNEETALCVIGSSDLDALLKRYPSFAMVLLVTLRNRLHQAESKIRDLAVSSAEIRIMNELIRHAVYHGLDKGEFLEIEEKITHQTLAEMTGVTRETVTKTLQFLQKSGLIEYAPGRLIRINKAKVLKNCIQCLQPSLKV